MIKKRIIFSLFTLFLLLPFSASAFNGAKEGEPLGPYYDVFRDPASTLTIEDILSGQHDQDFVSSTDKYLFFWHTDDTVWLRLEMDAIGRDPEEAYWIEAIDKLERIYAYLVKEDGTYTVQKRGFSYVEDQPVPFRSYLFEINDPAVSTVYLKIDAEQLPITLISFGYTLDGLLDHLIEYKFYTGVFYGILGALLFYNLFLFVAFKEKAYLYYILYVLCFMFYQACLNSLDLEIAGAWLPSWFFERSIIISSNMMMIFMMLFATEFLELKRYIPRHYTVIRTFLLVMLLATGAVFVTPNVTPFSDFAVLFGVLILSFLWYSGLRMLLKGHKMARFYIIGWTFLLSSILLQGFGFLGLIPLHPALFEHIPGVAACFEALFLSLALIDKINLIKRNQEKWQQQQNETLEEKVQERTEQLERARDKMQHLANTDGLTQIPNRIKLDQVLEEAVTQSELRGEPMAIILMDMDHFKSVNDQYGHQAGDQVLIETARILSDGIAPTQTAGRWGGEEFLIVCPYMTESEAITLAEKLRHHIEQFSFPQAGFQTGSFGVAFYQEGDTVDTMIARCDQALYAAKAEGRNRVCAEAAT